MALELQRVASGKRDRLVTVQQIADSTGTTGFPLETPTTLCRVWASREEVQAPERFTEGMVANQLSARSWTNWVLPYRVEYDPELVDVAKTRRLLYQGRAYDVVDAASLDRKKGVKMVTLAKVG